MKKKFFGALLALSLIVALAVPFGAETTALAVRERVDVEVADGFISYELENGEAIFCGYYPYYESGKEYTIPSYVDGYKVTAIGANAFYDSEFEKITIPNTVKTIESYAFGGHYAKIKELIIPDSVTTLCESSMGSAPYLEKIVIGNGVKEIPANLFNGSEVLKSVTLGSNVEIIGEGAFAFCTSIESVVLPAKVKTIGVAAFNACSSLDNITIPSGVTTIDDIAFSDCTSLTSIVIPDSVTTIGDFAFQRCTSLKTATVGSGVKELPVGTFEGCSALNKVTLGKNVTSIGPQAFMECTLLREISIPSKTASIGDLAFSGCQAIESIKIPGAVEYIGRNAFYDCISLSAVTFEEGITEIGEYSFCGTMALRELEIPDSVVTIGENAFINSGVESVDFGSGVEYIGEDAFGTCPNLKSVNIPDSVTYIGPRAFAYNMVLRDAVIGDGLEEVPAGIFEYCEELQSVTLGENVRRIDGSAFQMCHKLETVVLNEGLEEIGSGAFNNCVALKDITIPETVTKIETWAFNNCQSIEEITIPEGVTEIPDQAFCACSSLESVSLPFTVESIGEIAFAECENLREIYLPRSVKKLSYGWFHGSGIKDVIYGGLAYQWEQVEGKDTIQYYDITLHFGKKTEMVSTVSTKFDKTYLRKSVVYKNLNGMEDLEDNYVICPEATISYGGKTYQADEKGIVPMPASGEITVSAPGYRTEVMGYIDYMNGLGIFLEKETDLPIIKSVKLGKNEIRRSEQKFRKNKSDLFRAVVDTNGHEGCKIYIENGANKWEVGSYGETARVDIGKVFNQWKGTRLVVEMPDGRVLKKKLHTGLAPEVPQKPEISFGDKLTGIGGNTIDYVDTLKFDFSIPNFPFDISISGEKVIATVGVDVTKWSYSGEKGEWDNQYNAHKTLAEVIKNSHERMSKQASPAEEYENLLKDIGSAKKKGLKSKFGFDANITALGYLEGTITDRGIYFSDGGMIIAGEAEASLSGNCMVMVVTAPVPCTWKTALKGKLEAKLQVAQREEYGEELSPQGSLGASIGLELAGGPGIEQANGKLGVSGSLDPLFTFTHNSSDFKLDANVGVFVEIVFGPLELKDYIAKKTFTLYPKPEEKIMMMSARNMFSASEYTTISRDYLENPSGFVANSGISMFAENEDNETVLKVNTFKASDPQMADMGDGKRIVVWVDDDTDADELNGRTVMYSYFDGESWSEEQYVEKNGKCAYNPQIKSVGGKTYLVWESVDGILSEDSDVNDILRNVEIKYAVFNEETGKFEGIAALSDNNYSDAAPVISDLNGTAVVTWVTTASDDIFASGNNRSISYAVLDGTSVTNSGVAVEGLSSVDSHVAVGDARWLEVAYITDTDGDVMTREDKQLFVVYNGRSDQITESAGVKSSLFAVDGGAYFYNNGRLASYNYGSVNDLDLVLPSEKFIVCGTDKTVVYLGRNGARSDVYAIFCDEYGENYGNPVKLTDLGEYGLEDLSGFKNSEGEISLAFNKRHIADENSGFIYGQSDLSTVVIAPRYDIALDFVYADVNNMVPGYDTVIQADITNSGSKTVSSVNVALYDESGELVVSVDEEVKLLPGESETLEIVYTLPEDFSGFVGNVVVSVADESDTSDNSRELSLVCRDVSVDSLSYAKEENGEYTLFARVTNGSLSEEKAIKVKLMSEETLVGEKTVDSLGKLESTLLTFENVNPGTTYSVVIDPLENETMLGNNDEFITVAPEAADEFGYRIEDVVIENVGEEIEISADIIADSAMTENSELIVGFYNKSGAQVAIKTIPVSFDGETEKPVSGTVSACEFDSVKIMLWGANFEPLAAAVR